MPYAIISPYPINEAQGQNYGVSRSIGLGAPSFSEQQAFIKAQLQDDQLPQIAVANQQSHFNQRAAIFNQIAQGLTALDATLIALKHTSSVLGTTALSDNPHALQATVGTGASASNHSVRISQMATQQRNQSQAFALASSNPLEPGQTSGSLTLSSTQGAGTLAIDSSTTLTSLVQSINGLNIGIKAQLVDTTDGTVVALSGLQSGANQAISFAESHLALNFAGHQLQAAQDALGMVDNVAFSSATNVVNNAIVGISLDLIQAQDVPIALAVSYDASALQATVSQFVASYNAVVAMLSSSAVASVANDPTLRILQDALTQDVSSVSASASGLAHSLSEVGINLGPQGMLNIDNTVLNQAINNDARGVATVFADGPWGAKQGIADSLDTMARAYGSPLVGSLAILAQHSAQTARELGNTMESIQYDVESMQRTLQENFVNLNVEQSHLAAQNMQVLQMLQSHSAGTGLLPFGADRMRQPVGQGSST